MSDTSTSGIKMQQKDKQIEMKDKEVPFGCYMRIGRKI